jgi:chromosome segregation ATPase
MSDEAFSRSQAREARLWTPFVYSFPFSGEQSADRVIIYGLYSTSYKNQHGYLMAIEGAELLNLLNDYNAKIADLTMQQQNVVADIVTKRYLAGIDKLIHDEKMITKAQAISAEEAEWTAKIAALESDRASLLTLAERVTSETAKTNARISELQAQIETESYNRSEVDIEILNKEIQLAKADIEILDAANAVLKMRLEVVNAGLDLINVDLQTAKTRNEIESTRRSIARTDLLESELIVEQAQTEVAEAEGDLLTAHAAITAKKVEVAEKEVDLYTDMVAHEAAVLNKKILELQAEQARRITAINDRTASALFNSSLKKDAADLEAANVSKAGTLQVKLDQDKVTVMGFQEWAAKTIDAATIAAAETAAKAVIATELTHLIQKK